MTWRPADTFEEVMDVFAALDGILGTTTAMKLIVELDNRGFRIGSDDADER